MCDRIVVCPMADASCADLETQSKCACAADADDVAALADIIDDIKDGNYEH